MNKQKSWSSGFYIIDFHKVVYCPLTCSLEEESSTLSGLLLAAPETVASSGGPCPAPLTGRPREQGSQAYLQSCKQSNQHTEIGTY